eukprot:Hpha_TRINITY_DN14602_c0_g2::TRINITY_DN14602_c0_g2_i3::g.47969::m.47969
MNGQGDGAVAGSSHVSGGSVAKEDLGGIDVSKLAKDKHAKRRKLKEEAARRKASGLKPESSVPPPREAPAHQSKESNVASRDKLDGRGLRQLRPRLRDDLIAARDPVRLREVAQRRAQAIGCTHSTPTTPDTAPAP